MIKKYSISELINEIKHLLESEYNNVLAEGEITNLTMSSAGHWYFNLSDKNSMVSCALFKMDALRNPVLKTLKDGDKVLLSGPLSVYNKRGTFQIVGKRILKSGQGDLKLKYELLKKQLASEGLFDLSLKKTIPANPKRIAVITALGAAALQDFLNVIKRRSQNFDVLIIPAQVQGDKAPKELIKALQRAQNIDDIEVIVFTRGGGSLEDLWAFNDEDLVRNIAKCEIPVISAIGHEVDYTLCDYVSDQRLETPTAAAEVLTQNQKDLYQGLLNLGRELKSNFQDISQDFFNRLDSVKPNQQVQILILKLKNFKDRLQKSHFFGRMEQLAGLYNLEQDLDSINTRLNRSVGVLPQNINTRLESLMTLLSAYNPQNILNKGYTLVYDQDKLIKSKQEYLESDSTKQLVFHDGRLKI